MKLSIPTYCICSTILFFTFLSSTAQKDKVTLMELTNQIGAFDTINRSKVLVLGIHHFSKDVLSPKNQPDLENLAVLLSKFAPTKIVLELEPSRMAKLNSEYQKYLLEPSFIEDRHNEVYQLGFRLARRMNHDSIYAFDDQTEFIGSLEGFTFDSFGTYAQENDTGFYDRYIPEITKKFQANQEIFKAQNLIDQILLRNSPKAQNFNAQRMHSLEIRVGIQKSWIGPDWLGRFYRRNVRMAANVLKFNAPKDRILIIVGDNHKWILDQIFKDTPDFELVPSWDFLLSRMDQ